MEPRLTQEQLAQIVVEVQQLPEQLHSTGIEIQQGFKQQYLRTFHRLWGYEVQVFQPEIYVKVRQFCPQGWLCPALDANATFSLLHQLRRASLMLKSVQNIHPLATNLAFSQGLQVRSAFCDLPLAD